MFRKIGLTLATLLGITSLCFGGLVYQPNLDYRIKSLETIGRVSASSFLSSGPVYLGGTIYNPMIVNSSGTFLSNVQIIGNFALAGNILNPSTFLSSTTINNSLWATNIISAGDINVIKAFDGVTQMNITNSNTGSSARTKLNLTGGTRAAVFYIDNPNSTTYITGDDDFNILARANMIFGINDTASATAYNFLWKQNGSGGITRMTLDREGNLTLNNSTATLKIGGGATISTITANSADFGNNASIAQNLRTKYLVVTSSMNFNMICGTSITACGGNNYILNFSTDPNGAVGHMRLVDARTLFGCDQSEGTSIFTIDMNNGNFISSGSAKIAGTTWLQSDVTFGIGANKSTMTVTAGGALKLANNLEVTKNISANTITVSSMMVDGNIYISSTNVTISKNWIGQTTLLVENTGTAAGCYAVVKVKGTNSGDIGFYEYAGVNDGIIPWRGHVVYGAGSTTKGVMTSAYTSGQRVATQIGGTAEANIVFEMTLASTTARNDFYGSNNASIAQNLLTKYFNASSSMVVTAPANFPGGSYVVNFTSNNGTSLLNVTNNGALTSIGRVTGSEVYSLTDMRAPSGFGITGVGYFTGSGPGSNPCVYSYSGKNLYFGVGGNTNVVQMMDGTQIAFTPNTSVTAAVSTMTATTINYPSGYIMTLSTGIFNNIQLGSIGQTVGYAPVVGSSISVVDTAINSTSCVGVATMTVVLKGGRPAVLTYSFGSGNGSGAGRIHYFKITNNSVDFDTEKYSTCPDASNQRVSHTIAIPSTTAGSNTFCLNVRSSAANSPQTMAGVSITIVEY